MIIDEIMVVQKQDMQKHVRIPEITCTPVLEYFFMTFFSTLINVHTAAMVQEAPCMIIRV